jgi:hypothetical protein
VLVHEIFISLKPWWHRIFVWTLTIWSLQEDVNAAPLAQAQIEDNQNKVFILVLMWLKVLSYVGESTKSGVF